MAVKRRKFGRRKSIRRKPRVKSLFGGYMGDGRGFEIPVDKSGLEDEKKKFLEDYDKNTPSKFWLPSYLDHKVNKNVIDDTTMNRLLLEMNNKDPALRNLAREQLKDLLVMRDIQKNPDEYMREWLKGKHKKNTWVKTAARVGLGTAAALALGYGAYQWGTPMLGMLSSGYNWVKGKLGSTPSANTNTGKPDFEAMKGRLESVDELEIKNPALSFGADEKSDQIRDLLSKSSQPMTVSSRKSPGIAGYSDGYFYARNKVGDYEWVPEDSLPGWAVNRGNLTADYPEIDTYYKNIINAANTTTTGSGFRMTKRGRRLLKRYRRCLKRRKC